MSLNPFDNASEQAQKASEASEIVLANVEAISDDNSMAAVSNVGKNAKYPARIPRDVTGLQRGDTALIDTAAGGQPFVTAVLETPREKVDETVDVSDSGTSVLENASELNFNTNLSVSESDGTATIDASGGGSTSAIVDEYIHIIPYFSGAYFFKPTESNLFEHTQGWIGETYIEQNELVYDNANDRVFSWSRDTEKFYELPSTQDDDGVFASIQSASTAYIPNSIGYNPSTDNVIVADQDTAGGNSDLYALDPNNLSTILWSSTPSNADIIEQLNVTDAGDIYCCTLAGNVYQFDSSGTEQNVNTTGSEYRDIAVGTDGSVYITDYGSNDLRKFDSSLNEQWTTSTGISPTRCGVGSNNSVCVTGQYGLERYDSTGSLIWRKYTDSEHFSATVTPDGKLYAHTFSYDMVFDESDGTLVYRSSIGAEDGLAETYDTVIAPRPAAYPNEWT